MSKLIFFSYVRLIKINFTSCLIPREALLECINEKQEGQLEVLT